MTKLMICDPDLFAREGIKQMLAKYADFDVVHEAKDMASIFLGLEESRPDVCILDVAVARHAGLGFIRGIKSQARDVPLLVMGHCHERDFALRAMRAGASVYLPKDCTHEELARALKTAVERRPYVSDTICELIVESIVDSRPKRQHDKLSDTDFDIFCMLAEGTPTERIAGICKLSIPSVRTRKAKIMQQLALRTDADLVEYALKRKLIGHAYPVL